MNSSMKRKIRQNGFTVIEVLIVIAVAALILLVVFQAIPQLQRSQTNNARRSDVGRMIAAINTFITDNNGVPPGFESGSYNSTDADNDATKILAIAGNLSANILKNSANPDCPSGTIQSSGCLNGLSINSGDYVAFGPVDINFTCSNPNCGLPRALNSKKGYQMQIVSKAICDLTGNNNNGATSDGARSDSVVLQYALARSPTAGGAVSFVYCKNVN